MNTFQIGVQPKTCVLRQFDYKKETMSDVLCIILQMKNAKRGAHKRCQVCMSLGREFFVVNIIFI